jgi:predicted N-acetyltransferase YhbS
MLIREAIDDEIEIVRHVMYEAFKEYLGVLHPPSGALRETVEGIRKKIEGRGGSLIVWDESEPVGSTLYYFEEDYMYIGRVSVLPSHRGKGIGRAIIIYLEDLAKRKGYSKTRIEVRLSLPDNLKYYEKLNYIPIEEHEYPDKTDRWYTMSKDLKDNL